MTALLLLIKNTAIQFSVLFGVFLVAGAILTFLSRWTNNVFRQFRFPQFGIYAFGAIGIPVHEFCHAFFCKVFLHEVQSVKWFDPRARSGAHGFVTHRYNPWNLYHRIGHFFIGLGPVILAPVLLALLFYLLVPTGRPLLTQGIADVHGVASLVSRLLTALFSKATLTSWGFWLFLYLAICISSQMELSPEDLKQARTGTFPILLVLFAFNVIAWGLGTSWHHRLVELGLLAIMLKACVYVFAILLSALNLVLCTLLFTLINQVTGREPINPFATGNDAEPST